MHQLWHIILLGHHSQTPKQLLWLIHLRRPATVTFGLTYPPWHSLSNTYIFFLELYTNTLQQNIFDYPLLSFQKKKKKTNMYYLLAVVCHCTYYTHTGHPLTHAQISPQPHLSPSNRWLYLSFPCHECISPSTFSLSSWISQLVWVS